MKLSIMDGCQNFKIHISDIEMEQHLSDIELKKFVISRILQNTNDENFLDSMIRDLRYQMKPLFGEYDRCNQCGDTNSYEEFDI